MPARGGDDVSDVRDAGELLLPRLAYRLVPNVMGEPLAMYALGTCYEAGVGVPPDVDEAVKWYRKAAAQGNDLAKKRLEELNR